MCEKMQGYNGESPRGGLLFALFAWERAPVQTRDCCLCSVLGSSSQPSIKRNISTVSIKKTAVSPCTAHYTKLWKIAVSLRRIHFVYLGAFWKRLWKGKCMPSIAWNKLFKVDVKVGCNYVWVVIVDTIQGDAAGLKRSHLSGVTYNNISDQQN